MLSTRSDTAVELPVVLAFDVGGTKIATAVCDSAGGRLSSSVVATGAGDGAGAVLARLVAAGRDGLRRAELARGGRRAALVAAGVSTIGIPHERSVELAPAIPGWEGVALARHLEDAFGVPVAVGNDVKAAALAESRSGALRGFDPGLYLNLGTGLAAALVVGTTVLAGAHGAAGEIGYNLLDPADVHAALDSRPMLEGVVSGMGLASVASRRLGRPVTAAEVFEATSGSGSLAGLLDEFVDLLATHLVNLVIAFDPARVAVGGGLARSWERLCVPLERALKSGVPYPPELVLAAHPYDAALLGAVEMALERARPLLEDPARKSCVANDNRRDSR